MHDENLSLDEKFCRELLSQMSKQERREFFVRQTMKVKGMTFRSLATAHNRHAGPKEKLTAWGLNLAVKRARWTPRVVKCLERGLKTSLTPFLYRPGELEREKYARGR